MNTNLIKAALSLVAIYAVSVVVSALVVFGLIGCTTPTMYGMFNDQQNYIIQPYLPPAGKTWSEPCQESFKAIPHRLFECRPMITSMGNDQGVMCFRSGSMIICVPMYGPRLPDVGEEGLR